MSLISMAALRRSARTADPASDGDGLCFPANAPGELDRWMTTSIAARRERCVRAFAERELPAALRRLCDDIAALPALEVQRWFDDAAAGCAFSPALAPRIDDLPFAPDATDQLRWLVGALVEHGAPGKVAVAAPPPGFDRLYLARHHAVLAVGGSAVAIVVDTDCARLVTDGGAAFTLPRARVVPRGVHAGGALRGLPIANGFALLNGVPPFERLVHHTIAVEPSAEPAIATIREALALLDAAWPAVRSFAERWLRAILVLRHDGCARSHTSIHAPQVMFTTCESPIKVAEALCHELSHERLFLIMEQGALLHDDHQPRHRSPWRADPRPLLGLVAGVHAFLNVCRFYERLAAHDARHAALAASVVDRQRPLLAEAWAQIARHARWTPLGERFAAALEAGMQETRRP